MQKIYTTNSSTQKTKRHDKPIATFPLVDKPPCSQNNEHSDKGGTPHKSLLPETLSKDTIYSLVGYKEDKSNQKKKKNYIEKIYVPTKCQRCNPRLWVYGHLIKLQFCHWNVHNSNFAQSFKPYSIPFPHHQDTFCHKFSSISLFCFFFLFPFLKLKSWIVILETYDFLLNKHKCWNC